MAASSRYSAAWAPKAVADVIANPISSSETAVPARVAWPGPSLRNHASAAAPKPASSGGIGSWLASSHAMVDTITSASDQGEGAHQAR